jgi:hypothetical protein
MLHHLELDDLPIMGECGFRYALRNKQRLRRNENEEVEDSYSRGGHWVDCCVV